MSIRDILSKGHFCLSRARSAGVMFVRHFAKKSGGNPCSKSENSGAQQCVDDHPKPRSAKDIHKTFPFYDLIKFKMDCCFDDCVLNDFPSFDKCLYKESDKNKRKYQVTWVECPPIKIKPKKLCCFDKHIRPPVARRGREARPDTACKKKEEACPSADLKCPRVRMPRCGSVRIPPKCHRIRYPSDCTKVKTPYPAFSECARDKPRRKRSVECGCLSGVMMCQVYEQLRKSLRQGGLKLSPCKKS